MHLGSKASKGKPEETAVAEPVLLPDAFILGK